MRVIRLPRERKTGTDRCFLMALYIEMRSAFTIFLFFHHLFERDGLKCFSYMYIIYIRSTFLAQIFLFCCFCWSSTLIYFCLVSITCNFTRSELLSAFLSHTCLKDILYYSFLGIANSYYISFFYIRANFTTLIFNSIFISPNWMLLFISWRCWRLSNYIWSSFLAFNFPPPFLLLFRFWSDPQIGRSIFLALKDQSDIEHRMWKELHFAQVSMNLLYAQLNSQKPMAQDSQPNSRRTHLLLFMLGKLKICILGFKNMVALDLT